MGVLTMENSTQYKIIWQYGITARNQKKPKTVFNCKNELHFFEELNTYLASNTIYQDQIVEIKRNV